MRVRVFTYSKVFLVLSMFSFFISCSNEESEAEESLYKISTDGENTSPKDGKD